LEEDKYLIRRRVDIGGLTNLAIATLDQSKNIVIAVKSRFSQQGRPENRPPPPGWFPSSIGEAEGPRSIGDRYRNRNRYPARR
jgi:hypothetical protein